MDGSSRLTAVHKILRDKSADFLKLKSADVPYRGDDDAKFRADLRRMTDWIESDVPDESRSAVLRNIVVPAFIIVGFQSERPSTTFHTAVKSLVALRHVDPPTPWGPGPEHESLADEVIDQLEADTIVTGDEARYLRGSLTRDEAAKANLSPDPAIRAARIIDVLLKRDEAFKNAIRNAVTAQSTRKQSSPKLMKELAAVLILRGLDLSPREAEQKRKYLIKSIPAAAERRAHRGSTGRRPPSRTNNCCSKCSTRSVERRQLRRTSRARPRSSSPFGQSSRSSPMAALVGIRGFDRNKDSDERSPSSVIDAMRRTKRGVRQLGEVLSEHAAGKKSFRAIDATGKYVIGEDPGRLLQLDDAYLRAEYPDPGKVPPPRPSGDQPRDIYNQRILDLQTAIERLDVARDQVKACREHAETYGIDYRTCKKCLDVIHSVAKDLAVWEQADIKYHGRRRDDEDESSGDLGDVVEGEDEADDDVADNNAEDRRS